MEVRVKLRSPVIVGAVVLIVAAGVLAAAAAVSAARSGSAEQVVREYVRVALSQRDDAAAAALVCRAPQLDAIQAWQQDLAVRERQIGPRLAVDVASYSESVTEGRVAASVDITVAAQAARPAERLTRPFTFSLVDERGWKICAVTPLD
jgi:hypothetical protein